jgi:hypothetical protein
MRNEFSWILVRIQEKSLNYRKNVLRCSREDTEKRTRTRQRDGFHQHFRPCVNCLRDRCTGGIQQPLQGRVVPPGNRRSRQVWHDRSHADLSRTAASFDSR